MEMFSDREVEGFALRYRSRKSTMPFGAFIHAELIELPERGAPARFLVPRDRRLRRWVAPGNRALELHTIGRRSAVQVLAARRRYRAELFARAKAAV